RALVELERARLRGEPAAGAAIAQAALPALGALATSPELRLTLAYLRERIGDLGAPAPGLRVARDGAWIEKDGERVALTWRPTLAGILAALAEACATAPGVELATRALVRAGWPDERMRDGSAQNRVYTAIWSLRRMGLGDRLRRTPGGYLLDPTIAIVAEARADDAPIAAGDDGGADMIGLELGGRARRARPR
ncbi:MAG: hypothetical protein K8W52_03360, partial [Deltaproteobacteria bacterium]|nr:hypothetical protein [Deltaproteobacteria bacterium]